MERPWLHDGFVAPDHLELPSGHHLRQIMPSDVDLDYDAVMSSQPRLWQLFGRAWRWPPPDMTKEQDLADLERHDVEMKGNVSFNYAIFDREEAQLLGCVYIDPPQDDDAEADVAWWVVDGMTGTALEDALRDEIPRWLREEWPFDRPRVAGLDLDWEAWIRLWED